MGANVHRQRAPLNEALPATLLVASVRSLLRVYAMMSLQVRFAIEALQVNQPTGPLPPVHVRNKSEHGVALKKRGSGDAHLLAFRPRAGERPSMLAIGGRLTVVNDFEDIHRSSRVVGGIRRGTCASILQSSRGGTNRQCWRRVGCFRNGCRRLWYAAAAQAPNWEKMDSEALYQSLWIGA